MRALFPDGQLVVLKYPSASLRFALRHGLWVLAMLLWAKAWPQVNACSGLFYDSGGAVGNYANNENQVTTICPEGGAGSGPSTVVRFITFTLAPGPGDTLWVHNGSDISAPVLATGTSGSSLAGTTYTSSHPSGCLTFRWKSNGSGVAAGWFARIVTTPHPGDNSSATLCSASAPVSLFSLLAGNPDTGGSWKDPMGAPHTDTFDPSVDPGGNWTYTQIGPSPCTPASATLGITKVQAPDPGSNGSLTICSTDAAVSLFNSLGGTPDPGGAWTAPGGGAHSGTFNPATDPAGVYTYTVTGGSPCLSASATVTVTVNNPPNAGTDASTSVCSNGSAVNLFGLLGGGPDASGAWTGPGGGPVSSIYTPGTSTPGVYTYTVAGLPPCPSDLATVTVSQVTAPNAGLSASTTVCSDDAPFSMRSRLGGTPDLGGTWVGPGGAHGNLFNPATDVGGVYTYTVTGTPPCANATATLTITVRPAPNAGADGSVTLCSTDGVFALFSALGGSPDVGGTWRDPSNQVHSGNFNPASGAPGVYTYTVTGLAPCDPDVSQVTVTVNAAPNAGTGATVTRCSNAAPLNLFSQLGGSPNAGGSWTGPLGAHSNIFNPASDAPGAYTYTVTGLAPCANAQASITMVVVQEPDAGTNGTITVCGNDAPFSLFNQLGGTPEGTGTWTAPGGGNSNGTFTPGTSAAGVYTYTVVGNAPCANDQATVTVGVIAPPNPGTNGSITVCSNHAAVDLFALLGGSPQTGGTWTRPNGTAHSGIYQPATEASGNYTYTVQGNPPCAALSAVVQVTRVIAPNAGTNGTVTVCSTNSPFGLITVLGGAPGGGGFWLNPALAPTSGTFTPGTSAPGTYAYVIPGTVPCANDTGFATVNVNTAPNAGLNASITVCSSDAPFQLFSQLNGTPNAGGSWTRPNGTAHSGTFTPGTSAQGGYTYTVAGLTPCVNATAVVVVSVNTQPNAGISDSFTRCSTSGPVDLFAELNGTPNPGGTWVGPSGPSSGIFLPGTSTPGVYTYTVPGVAPCTNASATINAIINQAPNAGGDGEVTICQGTASIDLFTVLTGAYDMNGTWEDLDNTGQLSGSFFNTSTMPPGTYEFRYEVPANGACQEDHAHVDVTIVALLEAGSNSTTSACGSNTQVNLFNLLGGSPQPGGTWVDLSATGVLSGQFFNAQLAGPGSYQFRYRLTGTIGCSSDSAQVNLTVVAAPNAGGNGSTISCSNAPPFNMFPFLSGTPQGGGTWHTGSPNGPAHAATYDPAVDNPGDFYYKVNGMVPCTSASAKVTVTEVQAPWAGNDVQTTICSNGAPFSMTALLSGNPNPGGTWYFNNQNHVDLFVPGTDVQGVYEYRVPGQAPCVTDVAFLTISVTTAANAGCSGSTTVCDNAPPFLLYNVLTCSPQSNGTWLGPNLQPHTGTYQPGSSSVGDYLYIVAGSSPCASDTSVVTVFETPAANAGCPGSGSFCSNNAPVNLFTLLGCSPDPFGTWVGPAPLNPPFDGFFNPATGASGTYTYTVTNGCGSSSATVAVTLNQQPNAGCNRTITRCSNSLAFAMIDELGCSPQPGGVWTGPLPLTTTMNGVFIPGVTAPGTYRYRVNGQGACANATAQLTINVNTMPNAGNDNDTLLCATSGQVNLFPLLGTGAMLGGSWFLNGITPHTGIINPQSDVSGNYVYRITGIAPCGNDEATVFVQISQAPNAGYDGLIQVCSDDAAFPLINVLGGSPQLFGNWTNPVGAAHNGLYVPITDGPGLYKYKLPGNGGCGPDSSYVTVLEYEAVEAGTGSTTVVCSNAAPFQLSTLITGGQTGGTWTDPSGSVFTGTFIPGTSTPGAYKYKLIGTAPCENDSAIVTVFVNAAANAGISTLASICSNGDPVPLVTLLGGSPDNNGSWTYNSGTTDPIFDPDTDGQGVYVYTVEGAAPCTTATSQVVVTITQQASAGSNGSLTACVGADAIQLFDGLGGDPDPGGTWTNNCGSGTLTGGTYDASALSAGSTCTFTYTQPVNGPCPAVSAQVSLDIVDALDAGDDSSSVACQGQLVDLFASIGGAPQTGGSWVNVDNAPGFIGGVFNTAAVTTAGTIWNFDYVLPGSAACSSDTARVTIEVLEGPFAGCDGTISLCSNTPPVNLATALSCGPDAGGSWLSPSGGTHSGTFIASTDAPGVYRYVVEGVGACPSDTARVTVSLTAAANAGNDAALPICSNGLPVDMFTLLGPSAQSGGNWTYNPGGPPIPHSSIYNPAVDNQGTYVYTVQGTFPCPIDQAIVSVTEPQAPNAGCASEVALCSSDSPINMRTSLGCNPQVGGTWVYVTGGDTPHGNFFDPQVDLPGVYRYTVSGTAPCAEASALLTVNVSTAGNAGTNATVQACVTQDAVDLFAALGPNAQVGGTWTDQGNSQALSGNIFNPSMAGNGSWPFLYTVLGNGPCPTVSATVTVQVGAGSSAGNDTTITVCGSITDLNLFAQLGGSPTSGGTWTDINGTGALLPNGVLNVSALPIGGSQPYGYTVVDPGCGDVSSVIQVIAAAYPDPGESASLTVCSDGAVVDLFAQLGGTPDVSGVWRGPDGSIHSGTFDPGSDDAGNYSYTVTGVAPCADASSTVSVTVNSPANAGANGQLLACDTLQALDLFAGLQGTPQPGGSWLDLDGSGGLSGGLLNTTGIEPGEYYYRYTVTVPGCGTDDALVKVEVVTGVEVGEVIRVCNERDRSYTVSFAITNGDTASYEVNGLDGVISATAPYVFTSSPVYTSEAFEAFVRDQYGCAEVRVAGVSPCDFDEDVFVPESFSPNGDGVNELFLIPGIEGYPGNSIVIFNRWGAEIYKAEGYDNKGTVWDGTTDNGTAPSGTYFYVLELGSGIEAITGYIYLNR